MRFDQKDFDDDKKYPARELIQWKCLHRLIKSQPGTRKVTHLAEIAECAICTISRALEKNLKPDYPILAHKIVKRIARKLKNPKLLPQMCPEYRDMSMVQIKELLNLK